MKRKDFLKNSALLMASMPLINNDIFGQNSELKNETKSPSNQTYRPLAITMWDFSWIERRWPGAGYEDIDLALDQLKERGYNAVRIDAFPHLVATDPEKHWLLKPCWNQQVWGSPALNQVQIQPALNQFIAKCADRKIKVALSTWYRQDLENTRMKIRNAEEMAGQWIKTLQSIYKAGLLKNIFYVDLCNEWPGDAWTPFFKNNPPELTWGGWYTDISIAWMKKVANTLRMAFPEIPFGFSFDGGSFNGKKLDYLAEKDVSFLDFMDIHIWMAQANGGEFDKKTGYKYDMFKPDSYEELVKNGENVYTGYKYYWQKILTDLIQSVAQTCQKKNMPLATTECWGVVDYKDWPLLKWDWVKELCELGTKTAAATGQWLAISTSNFCGPQFKGMWNDIAWHKNLTNIIYNSSINESLVNSESTKKILKRLVF